MKAFLIICITVAAIGLALHIGSPWFYVNIVALYAWAVYGIMESE